MGLSRQTSNRGYEDRKKSKGEKDGATAGNNKRKKSKGEQDR